MGKIAVLTHINPDFDAICSASTLVSFLKKTTDNEVYLILEPTQLVDKLYGNVKHYSVDDVKKIKFNTVYVCDVNEQDRTYELGILNKVSKDNRYLFDHHDGCRVPLDIYDNRKLVYPDYSSTCEVLTRFLDINVFSLEEKKNLLLGIASDTAGFNRSMKDNTCRMIEKLGLGDDIRKEIIDKISELSYEQQLLFDSIYAYDIGISGIKTFITKTNMDSTMLVKHPKFDNYMKATLEYPVTIFIVEMPDKTLVKFKKIDDCSIDILEIAKSINGGGHFNRCSGKIYDKSLNEVIDIIKDKICKQDIITNHKVLKKQKS